VTAPRCSRLLSASSLLAVATLLTGCGSDSPADPAPVAASPRASSATSTPAPPATTAPAASPAPSTSSATASTADGTPDSPAAGGGTGCVANSATIPAGAGTAVTGDVDLDGAPDTVWLADTPDRTLGITTATGATFSTTYSSAAPQAASALGQELQPAGPAIVLLDLGRSVALYAVVDCRLVPTLNAQGQQYTFDLGFTGYGTGVGCVAGGDEEDLQLVGLDAQDTGNGTFRVTRTAVRLSDFGRRATNGATTVVAEGVGSDSPYVQDARTVGCGDHRQVAGEPQ